MFPIKLQPPKSNLKCLFCPKRYENCNQEKGHVKKHIRKVHANKNLQSVQEIQRENNNRHRNMPKIQHYLAPVAPEQTKKKGRRGGSKKGSRILRSRAKKLKKAMFWNSADFKKRPATVTREWLKDNNIAKSNIYKWVKKIPEWLLLTERQLNRISHKKIKKPQKGYFHEQEEKVYQMFLDLRGQGIPVKLKWFMGTMIRLVQIENPPHFDSSKHKFRNAWALRFCKRWKISCQSRTNRKAKCVYKRMHLVSKYHYFSVYRVVDIKNYQNPRTSLFSAKKYLYGRKYETNDVDNPIAGEIDADDVKSLTQDEIDVLIDDLSPNKVDEDEVCFCPSEDEEEEQDCAPSDHSSDSD